MNTVPRSKIVSTDPIVLDPSAFTAEQLQQIELAAQKLGIEPESP